MLSSTALPESQPQLGFLRISHIVPGIVPVCRATLWNWVRSGRFPAPVKLGPTVTAWRREDVQRWQDAQQ